MKKQITTILLLILFIYNYTQYEKMIVKDEFGVTKLNVTKENINQSIGEYYKDKLYILINSDYQNLPKTKVTKENFEKLNNLYTISKLFTQNKISSFELKFKRLAEDYDEFSRMYEIIINDTNQIDEIISFLNKNTKEIEYVEKVPIYKKFQTPNDPDIRKQWYIDFLGVKTAWDYSKGNPILIAIVDDWFEIKHAEFIGRYNYNTNDPPYNGKDNDGNGWAGDFLGYDVADNDPYVHKTTISNSHGTQMMGAMVANANNKIGLAGIAHRALVIPIKVQKDNMPGNSLQAPFEGVEYAIYSKAKIINMSWGSTGISYFANQMLSIGYSLGKLMFAADGNSGNNLFILPSHYISVLGIGSVDQKDKQSSFSNYNYSFAAPGEYIYTTKEGNSYGFVSGTSISTAISSGIAALYWSMHPTYTHVDIANCMRQSSVRRTDPNGSPIWSLRARPQDDCYSITNNCKTVENCEVLANNSFETPLYNRESINQFIAYSAYNYDSTKYIADQTLLLGNELCSWQPNIGRPQILPLKKSENNFIALDAFNLRLEGIIEKYSSYYVPTDTYELEFDICIVSNRATNSLKKISFGWGDKNYLYTSYKEIANGVDFYNFTNTSTDTVIIDNTPISLTYSPVEDILENYTNANHLPFRHIKVDVVMPKDTSYIQYVFNPLTLQFQFVNTTDYVNQKFNKFYIVSERKDIVTASMGYTYSLIDNVSLKRKMKWSMDFDIKDTLCYYKDLPLDFEIDIYDKVISNNLYWEYPNNFSYNATSGKKFSFNSHVMNGSDNYTMIIDDRNGCLDTFDLNFLIDTSESVCCVDSVRLVKCSSLTTKQYNNVYKYYKKINNLNFFNNAMYSCKYSSVYDFYFLLDSKGEMVDNTFYNITYSNIPLFNGHNAIQHQKSNTPWTTLITISSPDCNTLNTNFISNFYKHNTNNTMNDYPNILENEIQETVNLDIFPNPSHDIIVISSNNANIIDEYVIYNSTGNIIYTGKSNSNVIEYDVKSLENGVYFSKIKINNTTYYKNFVVIH